MDAGEKKGCEEKEVVAKNKTCWHRVWGHYGEGDGQFRSPIGLAVATDGSIYVGDGKNDRIQCFDTNGRFIRKWGRKGTKNREFLSPIALTIGIDDGTTKSIDEAMKGIAELNAFPPGLLSVCVAYVGEERIVVVDHCNHRMQVFNLHGVFVRTWGSGGSGEGQFMYPCSCDKDGDGLLYVADFSNYRIQIFRWDGTFVRKWRCFSRGDVKPFMPCSISVSLAYRLIYIGDYDHSRIVCCHLDGTYSRTAFRVSGIATSLYVADEEDIIYVCQASNHSVQQLRIQNGGVLRKCKSYGQGDGLICYPETVIKGADNVLYVADTRNHRIVAIKTQ